MDLHEFLWVKGSVEVIPALRPIFAKGWILTNFGDTVSTEGINLGGLQH